LKLRFTSQARLQLLAIDEYIRERNPAVAKRVGVRIREAVAFLQRFPDAGRIGRRAGTREWAVRDLP